jgi:hypothetical protein
VVDLNPAPDTLGLASPAVGPWFQHDTDQSPTLPLPAADLSVSLTLSNDMDWLTPAAATRSYFVATSPRTGSLRHLRQESGQAAFTDDNLVVLLTLLPEAELRLWDLTQPIPAPDGSTATPNAPARPRLRYLALEVAATTIDDVENLRPDDFPSDLTTADDKAAFVGLSTDAGLGNAPAPIAELLRPGTDDGAVAVRNRTNAPLSATLWAFDHRGRPLDPGAVANWLAFLASTGIWDNLWFDGTAQTIPAVASGTIGLPTTPVSTGRVVSLASAHEGPIAAEEAARLNLSGLTAIGSSTTLFTAGATPSIALTSPSPNDPPFAVAALPLGNYAPVATATPFAGWTGAGFPANLARDFVRIGFLDIERHLVGLTRSDPNQADADLRISAARNTASPAVLLTTDTVTAAVTASLAPSGGGTVAGTAMSPVMDALCGPITPPTLGSADLPDALDYEVLPLAGEGTTSAGGSAADQKVLVRFDGTLPAGGWIRLWTHGLDTETGLRFRQTGGAALVDALGDALVVLPIPDGTAPTTDDAVRLSFDALVVAGGQSRYFAEQRYDRPATVGGSAVTLPAPPGDPAGFTTWVCELAAPLNRGAGQYVGGMSLVAVPDDRADDHALIDLATLDPTDISPATLTNAAQAEDTLIITDPAFVQTPVGDLTTGPNGATLVNRTRSLFSDVDTMGRPAPSQERREVLALERSTNTGVIGSTPARAVSHENPPPQLAHAGVPAAEEIHGPGVALAGPATDQMVQLVNERTATDIGQFLTLSATPAATTSTTQTTTTWSAVLETTTFGVVGDGIVRAMLALDPTLTPGDTWDDIKAQLESVPGVDIDAIVDTSTFDDDSLAAAADRMIRKTRDGVKSFATSLLAAIGRAEDFLYLETPAVDPLTAESGAIDLIGAITDRFDDRPGLRVVLCVPEKYLPKQTTKLEEVRKAGVAAALHALQARAADRVVLFSPIAGPGRATHLAATTAVVDDALLLTGTSHLWRRGLTFDSALSVGLFDDAVTFGRPTAVRAARLQLVANALGLPVNLVPDDPEDLLAALTECNARGGVGRVRPAVYPPAPDPTSTTDQNIWNPDGRPGVVADWLTFFASLGAGATEFNNAIR